MQLGNKLTSYYRSSAYKQRLMNGLGISSSEADEIIESMVNKVNNTNINYNNYGTRFDKYGPAEGDAWAAADEVFIGEGVLEYDDLTIDDIIQHELGHSATEVITPSGKSINDQLPTLDFKEGFTYRTDYYGLPQEMRERGMSILRYLDNNNLSIDDFVKMDLSDLADAPYEIRQFKDVYEPTQQADYLKNIFSVAPIIGIGTVGAATLPDEIDTRQRGGALGTFGEYLPNKVLTMANAPEFFNNQAVYYRSDNPGPSEMRYNDIIREKVYAGTHGYNPATGQLVVLDKSVDVNPLDQLYNTLDRDEMPGSVSSGIASKDRKAYMDTLPADQREALEDEYKNMRKGYVSSSMSDMFENPLFYAPGLFGLAAGAGTLAAGAGSGLSSAMSAPLTIGSYVNPYITMSNILNAGFAADFLVNRAPTIPSLIQEGNYGEAALEGGFGALDVAGAYTLPIRAGSALGKLFRRGKSSIKPNKSFKSEIDWGKWNEEIPLNKELMQEYHAIEEVTKAKGTWMKNPDGSPFEGSPELFVQTQSNNFLKAFPDGYIPTYRGMTEKSFTEELISPRLKDSYTGVFTGNKDVAGWYGKPYYLAARKTDNSLNINAARREWTDIGIYANKADLEDAIERQKRLVETVKDMTNIQYTDGTLSAAQNRLNDLELILENWDDGNVQFNDLAAYINSDNVPLSYFGTDELAKYLEEVGLDNALVKNVYDGEFGDVLINNQVPGNYLKSLEGNNGMFDMTNPSMYKQTGGEERSIMMRPSQPITPEDVPLAHTFNLSSLQQRKAFNPFGGRAGAFNIPSGTLNPTMFGVYGDVAYNPEGIFGLGVSGDAVLNRELKPKDVQFLRSVGVNVPGPVGGSISPYVQFDGPMNTSIKGSMRFPVGGAGLPGTQGAPSFGLSLTKRFQDGGEETKDVFDIDQLKKGISYVESKDGLLMMNPESTATGLYGQLFSEFNKIPNLYSGTREEFAEDLDAQNRIFEMRVNDEIEGIPGLMKNAYELTEEYLPQLGDKFNFTLNEVAALSNFLGRQGARKYFGNVLRDGMSLEEVFPDLYSADANQSNKTPEKYIEEFRQALKEYGGEMELPKAQLGGFISKGIGLLRDAKKAYDEFDIEEFGRGLYEDMLNINEAYTPDYENNRDESEAKPFTKSNLNDFTYTQDEIDYINDVDNGYICTSGGCLKRAYTGWDNIVASRFSDVPGSWDIRRESGNLARNGNHPTNNRLFQVYNEDGTFRKYDTTTDSWDQHGVAVVNGGVNHFTLDQNKEKRFTDLSEAEQNAIYDKMTPGTIIGWGDDLGKYGVGFNTRGIGPDGKPLNLFSSRHSTIVIGKDVDGVPLIYDYDKVIRVTDPILNGTYNLSQLTNVTTPKSVSDLTYENLEERGLVNDEVDNLEVDVTKIYQDGLESQMKPFYTALKDNKVSLMNDLRLSNDDYNLIASGLLGLAMIESGGGTGFELEKTQQVNQIINRATLGFADNTLAPGDSVGLTQLNWDNIKNNPRLFNIAKRYGITSKNDLLNPTNSAIASVIFGSENLSAAKENYEMGLNPGIRDYKSTRGPSIFTPAELVKTIIREKQGKKLTFFDGKFRTEDGTVVNTQQTQTNYSPYGPVYSTYDRNIEDIQADLDDLYEPGNGIYYEAKKEDGEIVIYKYTLGNSELNDLEKFIYNWNSPNTLRKGDAQGESGYLNAVSKYINIDDFNVGGEVGTKPETYGLEDPSMLGLALYKDYIDGNNESEAARKNYDTFNARYYKQAKQNNTTAPDYIMSEVFKLGGSV